MLKKIIPCAFFAIILTIFIEVFAPDAFAQTPAISQIGTSDTASSFDRLVATLKTLFYSGRNLIFILSAFSLMWAIYGWISKPGDFDWKNIIWFMIALAILATIGVFIDAAVFGVAEMVPGFQEVTQNGAVDFTISNEFDALRNKLRLDNTGYWQGMYQ